MDKASNSPADYRDEIGQLVDEGIAWARRVRGRSVTVVSIELDDVGTLRGNLSGAGLAELLSVVGDRLAGLDGVACVRTSETFVLVSRVPRSVFDAFRLADHVVSTISRGTVVGAFEVSLAASMGVALSPDGIRSGRELLNDAHVALEEAKQRGRGKVVVLSPELDRRRPDVRPDIGIHFEPVVSLADGSVSTYEATVQAGTLPGFGDADTSTFDLLLDDLARRMATWPIDLDASCKVSTSHFLDGRFPQRVATIADRYSLEHDRFVFEIDAGQALEDTPRVQRILTRLRDDGWRIGVGGFDAATSVLSVLALLPVQFVSINRTLVEDADPRIWDLLSISAAGRSLQISTVASGIETLPELALALAHEYDFAQGPLFDTQGSGPEGPIPGRP
ncbi:MAG: EAL domain-containing protein [Acidimicrobiia bacterium]